MSDTAQIQAAQLLDIARRLAALSADKRKLFVTRLEERGIEVGVLPIVAGARPDRVPLSYAQQRLWVADQLAPDAALYNLTTALRLRGPLDRPALAAALDGLCARHEALRTGFLNEGGTPSQFVVAAAPMPMPVVDLSALPAEERLATARALAAEEAVTPFDLTRAPLLRARLVVLAAEEHHLVLTMHHLISDEWSNTILVGELVALYDGGASLATGSTVAPAVSLGVSLDGPAVQYADYALWQRAWLESQAVRRQLDYWEKELGADEYELALPTDRPRPAMPTTAGAAHVVTLPLALKERLTQLARRADTTLFAVVLAGYQLLLSRMAGQAEIRVGVPIANRHRPEVEGTVGFFSNTQVLRGVIRGGDTVLEHLQKTRTTLLEAQANQDLPFERLVDALAPARKAGENPLFEVMLSWHREEAREHHLRGGLVLDWEVPDERVAKFDLCLHATDAEHGIGCELVYRTELYSAATIEKMAARLAVILGEMAARPERKLASLEWLSLPERAKLGRWCAGEPQVPTPAMHEHLARVAAAHAGAVALWAGDEQVTYRQLEARANRLAHRLRAAGVGLEARVALGVGRNADFVVALYAAMKCGAAYVPMDPALPEARFLSMVDDCGAVAVVGPASLHARLAALPAQVARVDVDDARDERLPAAPAINEPVPLEAAAYVMYTSGSTGAPKGVVVTHSNLASYTQGLLDFLALPAGASMAMVSTVAADLGNTTLFGALGSGATLHLISETLAFDADAIGRLMTERAVDVLKIVPSHLKGLLQAARPGEALPRHTLIVGGEATDAALLERVAALGACRVVNHYGPTETTVGVLTHLHDGAPLRSATLPLGLPLPGRQVYVLDALLRPVPPGVVGEIHIGGFGVARGYDRQPELTASRFLPDPFAPPGMRMYKTGDRARRLADGKIEFLGRGDGQIKLRGHRIELGEIRAALLAATGAESAEVLVTESAAGHPQLSGYLLGAEPQATTNPHDGPAAVLARLAEQLPAHMVPAELVWLERFPVTANGKLDRKALAEVRGRRGGRAPAHDRVLPRTELEQTLARVWSETLGKDELGVHDNFFQLGGDSLLAFQVVAQARAAGLKLMPRDLFERQTVESLARALEERLEQAAAQAAAKAQAAAPARPAAPLAHDAPPLVAVPRGTPLPASFAQERLWFLWRLDPESAAYHAPIALRMTGHLDQPALARALAALTARHEILRTRLVEEDGAVCQRMDAPPLELPVEDLRVRPAAERDLHARAHIERLAARPFDLARGPLWRAELVQLADEEHLLVVVFHHVISDGWSTQVLARELARFYALALASGADGDLQGHLPPLPIQYADYAVWQRRWLAEGERERQLAYWKARLGTGDDHPVIELPTDRPRPPVQSTRGGSVELELGAELSAQLARLARAHDATLFMVLFAAWNALLARVTGQTDLRVGVPNANRHRPELDGLIGFFVNTQVLRTEVVPTRSFSSLIAAVKAETLGALQHQDLPFEQLVEALAPARSLAHSPLFQVMFNHQRRELGALGELAGLRVSPLDVEQHVAQFDLVLDTWEEGELLRGAFTYAAELFDEATVVRLAASYRQLLSAVAATPEAAATPIARLPVLEERERAALTGAWATGALEPLDARCLPQLIAQQIDRTPDATAVRAGRGATTVTYRQLGARARRLAVELRQLGVGPDVLVGLAVDRSPRLLTAALGVHAAGGAYVPLDPDYPRDRLAFMIEDARPRVLITEPHLAERFADAAAEIGATLLVLDHGFDAEADAGSAELSSLLAARSIASRPTHLAYVIYTSGSTGRPKGVAVPHAALVNFLAAMTRELPITSADRVLAITPISFDIAGLELFLPLFLGAAVVLCDRGEAMDPALLLHRVIADQVSFVQATPSTWRMVVGHPRAAEALLGRQLLCGGEALPPDLAEQLIGFSVGFSGGDASSGSPTGGLWNVYGPTETTIWSSIARLSAARPTPFLGAPLRNTTLYVLDAHLQPAPAGVAGELYIGGDGLARGYLGRPALTAERFVPSPFSDPSSTGARLYRTGDRVRRRADGSLEYLGRVDFQVKLRGHRVELGEIEARLLELPAVAAAAVILREDSPGDPRLVAYVVPKDARAADPTLDAPSVQAALRHALPDYMVPPFVVFLDALPRSPAGKLERKALPAPERGAGDRGDEAAAYVAPETPLQQAVAAIWAEALGEGGAGRRVGLGDHFFDLGGHSLLAARVTSRLLQELGVSVPLRALFEAPTLGAFAERVAAIASSLVSSAAQLSGPPDSATAAIPRADRRQPLPLSFAQERQWFLWRLEPESAAYHMPAALELSGALDETALAAAINALAERHEVLRTRFVPDGDAGERVHQIVEPPAAISLPTVDLRAAADPEASARAAIGEAAVAPFDLERGPLWRGGLYRLAAERHVLLVVLHHAIADEGSMHVMFEDLAALYAGRTLPALPVQYGDYAAWQRAHVGGEELARQLAYWKARLGDEHPVLELPADRARPSQPTRTSGRGASLAISLDEPTTAALRRLAREQDATLFMVLLAAFSSLLYRFTGQKDLRIGVPTANRGRLELERLIGFFINTQVMRAEVSGADRFSALLHRVKEEVLGAAAHQELPFEQLVTALRPDRSLAHSPLFQVLFNHVDAAPGAAPSLGALTLRPWDIARPTAQFELSVDTALNGGALSTTWSYATDLFDEPTIARLAAAYRQLLLGLASSTAARHGRIDRLPLGDGATLAQLAVWNATSRDHQLHRGFAERLAGRARSHGQRVALRHKGETLTFAQLAQKAHRTGWALRSRGIGIGEPIGVYAERGLEQIAMISGVLCAGAVYVALDVRHPDDRIAHIARASRARFLLATETSAPALRRALAGIPSSVRPQVLTSADIAAGAHRDDELALPTHPEQLAYVIYTSGSTGTPKGAMVTLAGMLNNQLSKLPFLQLTERDVIAQTAAPSFDISVWQMLTGLLSGALTEIVPDDVVGDPRALLAHVRATGVTLLESVPALIQEMLHVEAGSNEPLPLRFLLPTGEALPPEVARQWLRRFPQIPLVNAYGPAECADDVALCRIDTPPPPDLRRMPIGAPTDNTRLYVLDESLAPSPIGVTGQLAVAGVGVGRGYLADPARTAAVFVPHPFGAPGERLYLTGDLARFTAGGVLEYVGRADHQVKLRGHRIELGEIEARLLELPGVTAAVVALRTDAHNGVPGQPRLVGYVTLGAGVDPRAATTSQLRERLSSVLPAIMVPQQLVVLDALPRSANGKLDREALPAPELSADDAAPFVAPEGELEQALAAIWTEALELAPPAQIGHADHFFELGGHSLLATRVTSHVLARLGAAVPLRVLFEAPTLGGFAERVRAILSSGDGAATQVQAPLQRVDRGGRLPLSFAQERQWFLWRLEPDSAAYHIPMAARLTGRLDAAALADAFAALAERHEVLRTRFLEEDSEVTQVIDAPSRATLPFTFEELRGAADQDARLAARIASATARPFDLSRGPLWRIELYRLADDAHGDAHALVVVMHHIVADEVSLRLMMDELAEGYAARRRGEALEVSAPEIQYADYAAWQRRHLAGAELERQLAYWKQTLGPGEGHPVIELPTDRPRPAIASGRGALLELSLPAELTSGLEQLALAHGATLFMVLLAAWNALLHRVTGQTDLRVGVPNANRDRLELERLIGFFINTHVLRAEVAPAAPFTALLAQIKEQTLAAQAHQDLPFEQLVLALAPPRSLSHNPLFQVMFNFLGGERDRSSSMADLHLQPIDHARATTQFDLALDTWLEPAAGGRAETKAHALRGTLTYATDLFDAATGARLLGHFTEILRAVCAAPTTAVGLLPLMEAEARRAMLTKHDGLPLEPLDPRGLHEVIFDQARQTPDAIAVRHHGAELTYGQLARRARRLSARLRAQGVRPDELVGVCLERSPLFVVVALAVLDTGCAYAPLDPEYPRDRVGYQLADAHPRVLVTEAHLGERFAEEARAAGAALCIVDERDASDEADAELSDPADAPGTAGAQRPESGPFPIAHLAYCIYTSGSTGRPKGAVIPHHAIVNHLEAMRRELAIVPADRVLAIAPFAFDISVLEVFLPLIAGASVVIARRPEAMDPALLLARVRADQVTVVQGTPATWRMISSDPDAARSLRDCRLLSGGEAMPPDLALQLISWSGGMCNAYGPTETTVYSTANRLDLAQPLPMIGWALRNNKLYILDKFLQPVPTGVIGELYIGGDSLARGYWERPELTADKFLPDPFGEPGARLYRSGDLVRRHANGLLECVGRADFQVKLRGHRIELGEIEARLLAEEAVAAAAVLLRREVGDPRLVAYVVAADGAVIDRALLQEALRRALPEYMVPQWFVVLPEMPRSPSGKLDRRALPAPDYAAAAGASYVAPRTALEQTLADIWADALGLAPPAKIGAHDHFFELGGHSLLATKVTARILAELGVSVPLRLLFEESVLANFAAKVEGLLASAKPQAPLPIADRRQPLPLSFAQERQWFLWQLDPETSAYHIPLAVRMEGALDEAALARAFAQLTERHEVLRTRFAERGGAAHQEIADPLDERAAPSLVTQLLAGGDEATSRLALEAAIAAELERPFDLRRGPLWRARLYRQGELRHVLVVVMHHAISDAASLRLMIEELHALYAGRTLAPLAVQYADYAAWQRGHLGGEVLEQQLAYWKGHLGQGQDHPVIELPCDRPRPAVQSARGASLAFTLDAELAAQLAQLARAHGATLFMVLLAAWSTLLHRITGQTDLRIGVPAANRSRVELERLIGFFVNTHVLRAQVAPAESFLSLLAQVKETALGAQAHQELPFEQLVVALAPPRSLAHAPLFQVMFNHLGDEPRGGAADGDGRDDRALRLVPIELPHTSTQFDLQLTTWERGAELSGELTYATELFDEATVARLAAGFQQLLRAVCAAPSAPVATLPLLSAQERGVLLEERAAGPIAPLHEQTLPQLVAEQIARAPDAIAVRHADQDVTYRQLGARAARLASELSRLGVGPDVLVGLAVDRSPRLVSAVLGVHAAGGAYVPLDPDYPRDRLSFMIEDARPRVLVTEPHLAERFAEDAAKAGATLLVLDDPLDAEADAEASAEALGTALARRASAATPAHLAYVIYTSGSTGRPKGVAVPHAALVNFLAAMARELPVSAADRVLAITPISFDIAGLELFLPLFLGAAVVLCERGEATDPALLLSRIAAERASVVQATPSTWRMVVGHPRAAEALAGRQLLCGGEALPPDLAEQLIGLAGSGALWNVYGPTETTIWSSIAPLSAERPAPFLGAPLRNTTLYVLDAHLQPAPAGVAGELYIGGDGLARGYLGRPALTAERFVPSPFSAPSSTGARLYRTGDRVRRRRDGSLEYLGRVDFQVKLRGHRVELGEIEARLLELPAVAAAAVILREDSPGDPRLVAYLVRQPDDAPGAAATLDAPSVQAALRQALPDFMVPPFVVFLDALPRSPAGKLDREALPAPERGAGDRAFVAPRDDLERRLAALWQEVLGVAAVGVHDGFFDLGGHSLSATRLASRLREELAVELPLRVLFEATTVAELADALRAGAHGAISEAAVDEMSSLLDLLENP